MKRVLYILILMLIAVFPLWSQLTSITGEIRYQHQFQDAINDKFYSKLNRENPQFSLGTSGFLYSPSILSFNIQSTLNLYYNNVTTAGISSSYKQSLFNFYNVGIDALQGSSVRFSFSARDVKLESSSNQRSSLEGISNNRQREQRYTMYVSNVEFLPTTIFYFSCIHNFTDNATLRFNQRQNEFSLNLAQSNRGGNYSFVGLLNQNIDDIAGRKYTYSRLQFNGNKEFTPEHRIDINSEYSKYESVSFITGNGTYNGSIAEKLRLNSSLNGRNVSSPGVVSSNIGIGQVVQYFPTKNYNYSLSYQNQIGNDVYTNEGHRKKTFVNNWNMATSLQHTRPIGRFTVTNFLNIGYGQQRSVFHQQTTTIGINNSAQTSIADFQVVGNQGLTYTRILGYLPRDEVNNFVNAIITGTLLNRITSQTGVDLRSERRLSTTEFKYHRKTLTVNELLSTSQYYYIPLTITIGSSLNWFWQDINGFTYGINGTISSANFFLDGLAMNYRFNRTYDIYFKKPYFEHIVELNYQWRALSFQMRLQEFRFIDVRHEIWFIVTRAFNASL